MRVGPRGPAGLRWLREWNPRLERDGLRENNESRALAQKAQLNWRRYLRGMIQLERPVPRPWCALPCRPRPRTRANRNAGRRGRRAPEALRVRSERDEQMPWQ